MEKYQKEVMDLKRARRHYGRAWQEEGKEERCNYDIKKLFFKKSKYKKRGPCSDPDLGSARVTQGQHWLFKKAVRAHIRT